MNLAGVIGFGSAGGRHARLLAERGYDVLVNDPTTARAEAARAEGYEAVSEEELLARSAVVVVASPNHLHAQHLAAAVEAGADVLVEKPLAVVPDAALERTLAEASAKGQIVAVGCNLRFVPAIEVARALVHEPRLGRIVRVRADFGYDLRQWRPGRDYRSVYSARADEGGGVILDAIHEFDYLYWLFGAVTAVSCFSGSYSSLGVEVEDVAAALLHFEVGIVGEVSLDFVSPVYRRGFEIVAEESVASWRWPSKAVTVESRGAVEAIQVAAPDVMYPRLIDDFVASVRDRRPPRTTGSDGLAVLRIADAARRSSTSGAVIAPLDSPRGERVRQRP